MNPLAVAIGKDTAKQLTELGKSGLKKLLKEPFVNTAATNTQQHFKDIEVREALIKWSKSDDFVEVLTDLKEGATQDLAAVVPQFIESTGFYDGDQTQDTALRVIEDFLIEILDELFKSPEGLRLHANRQEVLHSQVKAQIAAETDRIIETLGTAQSYCDIDLQQISHAAHTVTHRLANELIDNRPTIVREQLMEKLDAFLASPARYCLVLGPTETGKSILLALEARHLIEINWITLLLRGRFFSLKYACDTLAQELSLRNTPLLWPDIIRPWTKGTTNVPGLAILLDAVDEAALRDKMFGMKQAKRRALLVRVDQNVAAKRCLTIYDPQIRSCAISMLGFLEFGGTHIEFARYASELLVRQAADNARTIQLKHRRLDAHISKFGSGDGMARLASYLCLKEQGDISTIHELRHFAPQEALANVFVTSVTNSISERLQEEYRKREEEEKKRWDERGTIWFQ